MIKKLGYLSVCALLATAIISCEKDFSDIGTGIVNNTQFNTNEIELEVEITPIDLEAVRADNIAIGRLGQYWLGAYTNANAKDIQASIISQLSHSSSFKTTEQDDGDNDTIYSYDLDKVVLKLPYTATDTTSTNNTTPSFVFDGVLSNVDAKTTIVVKRNESFLNRLNPDNPAIQNQYLSNYEYLGDDILSEGVSFEFEPKANDTVVYFDRINRFNPSETYKDTIRVVNSQDKKLPFLAIPLDLAKMKTIFWDEFEGDNFTTSEAFQNYFRGLKIESVDNEGSLIPFNLGSTPPPSIEFYYTKTILEGDNTTVRDTINDIYSLTLTGISNSVYKASNATTPPANNFIIQGTAGTMAQINILDNAKLAELRANNWLINDASLTFYINETVNTDEDTTPGKLFLYQEKANNNGGTSPTQLVDSYLESAFFGGDLKVTDNKPESYTFRITDYISKLLAGEEDFTNDPLILKVHNNPTDEPVSNNSLDINVKSYNWNPRAVTLYDGNSTNGAKKAVLKISYSEKK